MRFANLLFSAIFLLCGLIGVTVSSLSSDMAYFNFRLIEEWKYVGDLPTEYSFEEGVEYTVNCERPSGWELHWEVEPYGLKSWTVRDEYITNIWLTVKLRRDDEITIRCSSKNKFTKVEENRTTHFVWNDQVKHVSTVSMDAKYDEDDTDECFPKNSSANCASIIPIEGSSCKCMFVLKIHKRIHHEYKDGIGTISNAKTPMGMGWVPVLAGVAGVGVVVVVCFITYRLIRKRQQQPDELYSYTYAHQIGGEASGPPPPPEEISRYAKIIGILRRKKPRVEDLVYAEILYDGPASLQGPSPPPLPPRFETSPSSSSAPSIEANDISQRAPCPLPAEELEENKKYVHYDTPYEWRIWRLGNNSNSRAQPPRRPCSGDGTQ